MTNDHWRWNVDPFWENFSALLEEVYRARRSPDDVGRHRHCRGVLLFAGTSLEAFLNQRMRKYLSDLKTDEKKIVTRLRKTEFKEKIEKWPTEFCGQDIEFEDADSSL